mgnify:CR=1 FL=1
MTKRPNAIRKLARSVRYQNLFCMAKEIGSVHLFDNTSEFSKIQLDFLYWVSLYNRLYTELAMKDNKYLSKKIIETDNWLDYYLIWERRNDRKKSTTDDKKKVIDNDSTIPGVRFTRG